MKWIAISGSWQKTNEQVEKDVRSTIRDIFARGDGIVTGGALGVDYFATDEMVKLDSQARLIKVFLPTTLERYAEHYRKRAEEGVITNQYAELLIEQLTTIKKVNPGALIENKENQVINKEAYFDRISKIIESADELVAFQVNKSEGTQDTIDKAQRKGIPVKLLTYTIA